MARCLISFGANIGDARATVSTAAKMLRDGLVAGDRLELSHLYQTPPVGGPSGQPPFVNAVAAIQTQCNPWELWHLLRSIEQQLGRERIRRWEARRIDLDILLYEDLRIWTGQLKIPHPRMCMRRFILLPAMDVAADWLDPVSQLTIAQLANQVSSGKGTIILVSSSENHPQTILQEASRAALARWIPSDQLDHRATIEDAQRAVSWIEFEQFFQSMCAGDQNPFCPAKLLFFLMPHDDSVAWEDQHRELAIDLRLRECPVGYSVTMPHLFGPRYLLATNDQAWATHELVAALDAMDCPVERLTAK